jgi:uncharacterized membrane protein YgaE (UPF0421/DUF939 family)
VYADRELPPDREVCSLTPMRASRHRRLIAVTIAVTAGWIGAGIALGVLSALSPSGSVVWMLIAVLAVVFVCTTRLPRR